MLHNNIKLNILNGIMFKKRPLRCDSDGVRAKTWTLGVWGWTLTECVHSKAWLRAVWGVTLTECVQRCWLLAFCEFKKVLVTGLAEAERQLCLQSLHNLPYTGLVFRDLGLDSDGVRTKTLVMRGLLF